MSEKSFAVQGSIEINGINIDLTNTEVGSSLHRIGNQFTAKKETPIGTVVMYTGLINGTKTNLPNGWLLCDGTETSVSLYPELDAVLGTRYGDRTNGSGGAGSTHFRIPNLVDKIPVGHIQTNTTPPNSISAQTDNSTLTALTHNHSTVHNSSNHDGFSGHTHGSNVGNSNHTHSIQVNKERSNASHNLSNNDAHTHDYKYGNAGASSFNFSSGTHYHNSSTVNIPHGHNSGNANNGSVNHNSNGANLDHAHQITLTTSDNNQNISVSSHQHGVGFNSVKVFFIIKAKNEV